MPFRRSLLLASAALSVAALTACGGGGGGSSTGGGGSDKTLSESDANNPSGNISWCIGKDTTGAFNQVVSLYNQSHPGVHVKLLELPTGSYQVELRLANGSRLEKRMTLSESNTPSSPLRWMVP